jgi:hypothetical protein
MQMQMNMLSESLANLLQPIANFFAGLGIPEPIVHWGHPAMMATVVFVMGSFVGWAGWRRRLAQDENIALGSGHAHRRLALWMLTFISLGYTGGLLSLVMQDQPILESPHFWTGTTVIGLLGLNGALSRFGFQGEQQTTARTLHAYLGSLALVLLAVHALLGFNLGLSLGEAIEPTQQISLQ